MSEEYKRKKRRFVIKRLKDLSILPADESLMTEEQIDIFNQVRNYDFTFWEKIKIDNGWGNSPIKNKENNSLPKKRRKVREYLRKYNVLPPYNHEVNEEQQLILNQINNNDFSYFEKFKLELEIGKQKYSKERQSETYKSNQEPKLVKHRLRMLQILPSIEEELNDTHNEILSDIDNNWLGKEKSHFIKKYLHLSTPVGRLYYRLYKSHQDFGFNFNLTHSDIIIPEYCPLLNIKLSTDPNDKDKPNYYTGDRIDSSKGLVKGNIQVISLRANKMKSKATESELLQFATNALKLFTNEEKL